jgi:LPS export ABC transporter protein LptC
MSSRIEGRKAAFVRRRTRVANALSYVSAGLTVLIILIFIWQAGLFRLLGPGSVPQPPTVEHPEQIAAGPSTISGLDKQNLPYSFSAASALQDKDTPSHVHLDTIRGTFQQPGNATYHVKATTGLYDTRAKTLDLAGEVEVVAENRFVAQMESAHVTVRDKQLVSDKPVTVTLDNGSTVIANGLKITDDGHNILFLNGVKASFKASQAKGDAQP